MTADVVGIDLGTTNSLVGTVMGGEAKVLADPSGELLLPSVVGSGVDGSIMVGRAARNQRLLDPAGTVVSVKRRMGERVQLRVGKSELSPAQVSALILGALLDRVEDATGQRPARAVITVPAMFDDAQRQATRDAGEIAGLGVERLVNEPTAAALRYQTGQEQNVLVYDFGGGTFDVSILEMDEGLLEVRTSRGDTELGGSDIDAALLDWVLAQLDGGGARVRADLRAMTRLCDAVERAKIALSTRDEVRLYEPFLSGDGPRAMHLDLALSREHLNRIAAPFVERTLRCIDTALQDAALSPDRLDRVVLVGGTSKMPLVQERVAEHLGRRPLCDDEADRAVALGASQLAGRVAGEALEQVLVDITPHTLAIGVLGPVAEQAGYGFGPKRDLGQLDAVAVIARDTVIPVERERIAYTIAEDQPAVRIPIVQGEAATVGGNTWLGEVLIEELPPGPAHAPVQVRYQLDLSGVLHVVATHLHSGKEARVTVANSPTRLSEQRRAAQRAEVEALRARGTHEAAANDMEPEDAGKAQPGVPARASAPELALARAMLGRADRALEAYQARVGDGDTAALGRVREAQQLLQQAVQAEAAEVSELCDALSDALLDLV
jgi:molecular chaperone DnaK